MASVFQNIWNGIKSWFRGATGTGLTDAQMEANQFSAEQAQISREWDERMYNQYNSPAALVRQYQDSGINPSLMFGGSTPAAPQSSGEPSSVSPSSSVDFSGLLHEIANLGLLREQIKNVKAQTEKTKSETVGIDTHNQYLSDEIKTALDEKRINIKATLAGIDKVVSEIGINNVLRDVYNSDVQLKQSQISLNDLEKALKVAETVLRKSQTKQLDLSIAYEEFRKSYRDEFGIQPDQPLWNSVISIFENISRRLGNGVISLGDSLDRAVRKNESRYHYPND